MKVVPDEMKNQVIQTSQINVDSGMTFEVDHCGDGDELVLCLHGFPEHSFSWRYQLPMLAQIGFTAWAPNLRGYGNTSRPDGIKDYALSELVEDVAQLIAASKKKKVTLSAEKQNEAFDMLISSLEQLQLESLSTLSSWPTA